MTKFYPTTAEFNNQTLQTLFDDRLPLRPYCTDEFIHGIKIRGRKQALNYPYIQVNPPTLRFYMVFDIDRVGGGLAWEEKLPAPYWATINKENGHAHVAWGLSAPVLTSDGARERPLRYLCAIEAAYRETMQADSGYSGLITKNPLNKKWLTFIGNPHLHELGYLADWVDLPKFTTKNKPEEVGLGRNCTLFDFVRLWAYRAIRQYREPRLAGHGGKVWNVWLEEVRERTLWRNGDFRTPLQANECFHIAKSIAKYCWHKDFDQEQSFLERQAWKGKKGAQVTNMKRWGNNEDKQASARLMMAQGMSITATALSLGVHRNTVWLWQKGNDEKVHNQPKSDIST